MSLRLKLFLAQAFTLLFVFPHLANANENIFVWRYSSLIAPKFTEKIPHNTTFFASKLPEIKKLDNRAIHLQNYLVSRKSPLATYSTQIVDVADKYGLDWKLLVAISGVESGFGRVMPQNSFNAYGWSGGTFRFASWENSIEHVSRVLAEKYAERGLKTPEQIARVYCPGSDTWASNVKMYMRNIEGFISKS